MISKNRLFSSLAYTGEGVIEAPVSDHIMLGRCSYRTPYLSTIASTRSKMPKTCYCGRLKSNKRICKYVLITP